MTATAKSAKTHPTAKKCCGWEEPFFCLIQLTNNSVLICLTLVKTMCGFWIICTETIFTTICLVILYSAGGMGGSTLTRQLQINEL